MGHAGELILSCAFCIVMHWPVLANWCGMARGVRMNGEAGRWLGDKCPDGELIPVLRRICIAAVIGLIMASGTAACAQQPARNGNESDFRDWQPTRGQVTDEERAAGVSQTPQQRKAEDRELQDLSKDLLRQEAPASPTQPGNSR